MNLIIQSLIRDDIKTTRLQEIAKAFLRIDDVKKANELAEKIPNAEIKKSTLEFIKYQ